MQLLKYTLDVHLEADELIQDGHHRLLTFHHDTMTVIVNLKAWSDNSLKEY